MKRNRATVHGLIELSDDENTQWDADAIEFQRKEPERLANNARIERNRLLRDTDWTHTLDAPVDRAAWAVYRQALRDVPQQAGFPSAVDWPVAPS